MAEIREWETIQIDIENLTDGQEVEKEDITAQIEDEIIKIIKKYQPRAAGLLRIHVKNSAQDLM